MANPITTAQDLQDILDAIYNNREHYDTYQNLTLYYNDITRTATIFTVDDEEAQEPTKNVIAVFNPENIVTSDNAFFVTLMKSATVNVSTEETSVYDFALGGYVDVNTLLKNICVALGVSLSGTFADANPTLYSDMINIIRNEYGQSLENNAPYIMKKFVNVTTQKETYKSLVPFMCIVRIAIYLNNTGIFASGDVNIQSNFYPPDITVGTLGSFDIPYPTITELGFEVRSKKEFIDFVKAYYTTQEVKYNVSNGTRSNAITFGLNAFDKLLDLYENEIDFNEYVRMLWDQGTTGGDNYEHVWLTNIPKDKYYANFEWGTGRYGGVGASTDYFAEDGVTYSVYDVTVTRNHETQEDVITNSKGVYTNNKEKRTFGNSSTYQVNNIKPTKYKVPYRTPPITYNNERYYGLRTVQNTSIFAIPDYYNTLDYDIVYSNLKLCSDLKSITGWRFAALIKNSLPDLEIGENDLVYFLRNSSSFNRMLVICRNANSVGFKIASDNSSYSPNTIVLRCNYFNGTYTYMSYPLRKMRSEYFNHNFDFSEFSYEFTYPPETEYNNVDNIAFLQFNESISIDIITIKNNDYTVTMDSVTRDKYYIKNELAPNSTLYMEHNNLFELRNIEVESSLEGLTLINGAVYPKNVIDESSFMQVYPNWFKTQSNNPQIVNGVLAPTVTSTQWGAVSISKTTPTTQGDSEGGDIDFTNPEDVQDIIDDVDNATEDSDVDPGGEPDQIDDVGSENEGTTPSIPDNTDLMKVAGVRVYALDSTNMARFNKALLNPNFWANLIGGDPMKWVINCQATPAYDGSGDYVRMVCGNRVMFYTQTEGAQQINYYVGAHAVDDIYVDYDFGTIVLPYEYNNYNDIESTTLTLYLPFIGYVNLDTNDFMDKVMHLNAKVDLTNGNLIYYVGVSEMGKEDVQTLYQFQGNCHRTIPLTSNTSILNALKNTF